jgi:hypothetical protein
MLSTVSTVSGWLVLLYRVSSYLVVVFRNILYQNRAVFFLLFRLGVESLRNPPPPFPNKLTRTQPRPFMNVP